MRLMNSLEASQGSVAHSWRKESPSLQSVASKAKAAMSTPLKSVAKWMVLPLWPPEAPAGPWARAAPSARSRKALHKCQGTSQPVHRAPCGCTNLPQHRRLRALGG